MTTKIAIQYTLLVLSICIASLGSAATIRVEKWGDDTTTCGSKNAPCGSISHAINNRAGSNDRLLIGPGHYAGHLTVDTNATAEDLVGLKLESTNGKHATIIQTILANTNTISIHQAKVRIGKKGKGFTIGGADTAGYYGIEVLAGAERIRIEGNRVMLNDSGMMIRGEKAQVRHNLVEFNNGIGILCDDCDRAMMRQNEIRLNNDHGMQISNSTAFQLMQNVTAWNNGIGSVTEVNGVFYKSRDNVSEFNDSHGFTMTESAGSLIQGNIALLNQEQGFSITHGVFGDPPNIRNNAAIFNDSTGMILGNVSNGKLDNNTLVDNGSGILVIGASSYASFRKNSTWGSADGCGISNVGGTFDYSSHFFGAAEGPDGVVDADGHDAACPVGTLNGSIAAKPAAFKAKKAAKL